MSILLSAYFKEGIVFAADKNATLYFGEEKIRQDVEVGQLTKVFTWPFEKAVVGFVGLGVLAGLEMDEWMRLFISKTRDFDDLDELARELRNEIQRDFDKEYSGPSDVSKEGLIIHLGGFVHQSHIKIPAMYLISNVSGLDKTVSGGGYKKAVRKFSVSDQMKKLFKNLKEKYPERVRPRIIEMEQERELYTWFNNGAWYGVFNIFKQKLWESLQMLRGMEILPENPDLMDRVAYCRMAVRMFGGFFEHFYLPHERVVGGGVDSGSIPWL